MKAMSRECWGSIGCFLVLSAACTWAAVAPPLYVGNLEPVRDQYDRPLVGSYHPAAAASRSRVEIRTAPNGIIYPPSSGGIAHPNNPALPGESVGGVGMNAAEPHCGLFAMVFPVRPPAGTKIFARSFNAPTAEEASFYADSALVTLEANATSLVFSFGPAKPLDDADDDGDGLINSWEKALGIDDRLTGDYDGDNIGDYQEMLAGTAPDDPGSLLAFREIRPDKAAQPAGGGGQATAPVRVKWQSVPGKSYQLFYIPDLVGEQEYIPVGGVVTADDDEYEIEMVVDLPTGAVKGNFRVKLVVPEP